jgi:two-component system, NtrC family, response regulator HydG
MATVLIVDDERPHVTALARSFRREGHDVLEAGNGREALEVLRQEDVHLVVTDLMMPEMDGLDLLKAVQTIFPDVEVILMTAFGTVEKAVEAMRMGAYDFVTKPVKRAVLLKSARQALQHQALVAENRSLRAELAGLRTERSIVGNSPAIREVHEMVRQAAPTRATVLLTGESGTGKELFARALHDLSDRRDMPFVAVNCAALPESILEAELFGTEKGAFTGATQRKGRFEAASGGTLFLDEIGELTLSVQVKLLRVLEEDQIVRLGTNTPTPVDVRIVTATNKDLDDEIRGGRFRQDLYYRLNVVRLGLPPLRGRSDDVRLLAAHFARLHAERNGKPVPGLTRAATEALSSYPWPGNVRELENTIERAVVLDRDGVLDIDDLPDEIAESNAEARSITIQLGTPLEEIERAVIQETLRMTKGDKKLCAQLLGIATRTIYRKL